MLFCCRRFEIETIAMTASVLHGDTNVVGSVTSGGMFIEKNLKVHFLLCIIILLEH